MGPGYFDTRFVEAVLQALAEFTRQAPLFDGPGVGQYLYLDALITQAKDKRTEFDWFDAAVLSFKLTQSLIYQADDILNENFDAQMPAT